MANRPLSALVMAAGQGSRMRSELPKPLHPLCGRPILLHVLDALAELLVDRAVVVVGSGAERVTKTLLEDGPEDLVIDFVEQRVRRGTGDAVSVGLTAFPEFDDDGDIVVLPGDTPLVQATTLQALVSAHRELDAAATLLSARLPNPRGMGRVIRSRGGTVAGIVEDLDATEAQREIDEVATSIYCFRRGLLAPALRRLNPDNAQGEYYLTDVIAVLADMGHRVEAVVAEDPTDALGVNDRNQLAAAEAELRTRINRRWMQAGVAMVDPATTYVDAGVQLAADVTLLPGTVLQGRTVVGPRATLGPMVQLSDCVVGESAVVQSTTGVDAEVGAWSRVGPHAYLPPGSHVPESTTTGAFYTASTD